MNTMNTFVTELLAADRKHELERRTRRIADRGILTGRHHHLHLTRRPR